MLINYMTVMGERTFIDLYLTSLAKKDEEYVTSV